MKTCSHNSRSSRTALTRSCRKFASLVVAASLMASAGILSPLAMADEPEVKVQSRSSQVYMLNENGRKVEVRIEDGKLATAIVDGKAVPADRVLINANRIVITDADGKVITQIDVPDAGELRMGEDLQVAPPNGGVLRIAPDTGRITLERRRNGPDVFIERPAQMPEAMKRDVMLGIRQMPLSGVLARHLGLEPGAGSLVAGVAKGMPAAAAGLKPYDVILTVNGEPVTSETGIAMIMQEKKTKVGELVKLGIIQQGARKEITLSPIAYNAEEMEKAEWDEVDSAEMAIADGETRMFFGGPEMGQMMVPGMQLDRDAMRQQHEMFNEIIREFGGKPDERPNPTGMPTVAQRMQLDRIIQRLEEGSAKRKVEDENTLRERLDRMEKQLQQLTEQLNKKP